jgi:urease accessory protein
VISDVGFSAPFKLTSPFYDDAGRMSVMAISVSAGLMSGDSQEIELCAERGARVQVGSQAFEKIHRMEGGGFAERRACLDVKSGATLIYSPLPAIPFAGSAFRSDTRVTLEDSAARLFLSDIVACGRASRGERFEFREYRSRTRIFEGGALIYYDNAAYIPADMRMEGFCMFEGYTHCGSLALINFDVSESQAALIRDAVYALPGAAGRARGIGDASDSGAAAGVTAAAAAAESGAAASAIAAAKFAATGASADSSAATGLAAVGTGIGGITRTGHGDYCVRALCNGSEPLLRLFGYIQQVLDA